MKIAYRQKKRNNEWGKILKDYSARMPIAEIMKKYGISKSGLYYILDELRKSK